VFGAHDSGHAQLLITRVEGDEVLGHLVIDSFEQGCSHGGVRTRQGVTEEEIRLSWHVR